MIAKIAIVAAASIASAVLANKTLIEKNAAQQDSIKKLVEFNEYLAKKLDDANVTRFCDLMDEMTRRTETRFLVITHHAVTMSRMDRLFGVTMVEQGVSQLVSVDLKRAEALVA